MVANSIHCPATAQQHLLFTPNSLSSLRSIAGSAVPYTSLSTTIGSTTSTSSELNGQTSSVQGTNNFQGLTIDANGQLVYPSQLRSNGPRTSTIVYHSDPLYRPTYIPIPKVRLESQNCCQNSQVVARNSKFYPQIKIILFAKLHVGAFRAPYTKLQCPRSFPTSLQI